MNNSEYFRPPLYAKLKQLYLIKECLTKNSDILRFKFLYNILHDVLHYNTYLQNQKQRSYKAELEEELNKFA